MHPLDPVDVILRENRPEDYRALCSLLGAVFEEYRSRLDCEAFLAYLGDLAEGESAAADQILVAERAGLVVGTATYRCTRSDLPVARPNGWGTVRALAVAPAWRRRGIGRLLVEACITRARADRAQALCMNVPEALTPAFSFCQRLGFEPAGREHDRGCNPPAPYERTTVARAFCRRLVDAEE
jgi:GNAT superfamily N-acetyltransferase